MNHLDVLYQKIAALRAEIASIQELNERYHFGNQNEARDQVAHLNRQQRLQDIQEELIQLSRLGQKTLSIEQMREKHRSRLHLVKQAS